MKTGGTEVGGLFSFVQIAAVSAAPDNVSIAPENTARLKIIGQFPVALSMLLFSNRYGFECDSNFREAFLSCSGGEGGVHGAPLMLLTRCGGAKVIQGGTDSACGKSLCDLQITALKKLEEALGVLLLLVGGLLEYMGDLHQALFAGGCSKISVAVACLGLSGK